MMNPNGPTPAAKTDVLAAQKASEWAEGFQSEMNRTAERRSVSLKLFEHPEQQILSV